LANKFKTALRHPLAIAPYSQPYTHIVRFKNGRANLLKTFIGMAKGQDLLIRMTVKVDRTRIKEAARNARVRVKVEEHPALDTVRVTSLGPQRERVMSETIPGRVQRFRTRGYPVAQSSKALGRPRRKNPNSPSGTAPDIFS
jgi:hypothetical protein